MKPNKRLLEVELNKTRKLMEDMSIVNSGDLGNNWDPSHVIRKTQGLTTYEKNGYSLIPREDVPQQRSARSWSYKGKNLVYTTPEQANELNELGLQIRDLINQYNEKYQQYVKD